VSVARLMQKLHSRVPHRSTLLDQSLRGRARGTYLPALRLSNGLALLNFALTSGFVRWAYRKAIARSMRVPTRLLPTPRRNERSGLLGPRNVFPTSGTRMESQSWL
jgi:hypothetical protein